MNSKQLNGFQTSFVLEDIARTARALSCIGSLLEGEGAEVANDLGIAVNCLAQRAGWLADMVREQRPCGFAGEEIRSPMEWSLPPAFFGFAGAES